MLLRAYPPDYRADRAEEMLGTVLEAARPGQEWPSARDAWSFLRGGIAARAARNRRLGLETSVRQAAALGLTLYLGQEVARQVFVSFFFGTAWGPLLVTALLVAAVLAVWTGRRAVVAIIAAAYVVVRVYNDARYQPPAGSRHVGMVADDLVQLAPLMCAVLALIVLTRRDERLPRSWLLLAGLPVAVAAASGVLVRHDRDLYAGLMNTLPVRGDMTQDAFLLVAVGCVGWLVTDTRPALGVALFFVVAQVAEVFTTLQAIVTDNAPVIALWQWDITILEQLGLAAFLMAVAVWILRRRTRARRETMS
jgi:hypothetical protein